ncbi:MAG TPA: hypothetical protein DCL44_08010 [Elusimicrobia bacterium]|nr:hypothetical protein [Elusimicrobiota bacterium]
MKKYSLSLLVGVLTLLCNSAHADDYIGQWKLFIDQSGQEVSDKDTTDQTAIGLVISKTDEFYTVRVGVRDIKEDNGPLSAQEAAGIPAFEILAYRTRKWEKSKHLIRYLQDIKRTYSGKYILSDDGKTIDRLSGDISFKYRKAGKMICSESIGCFNHGKAVLALSRDMYCPV